jgi:hypothetical protein
MGQRIDVVLLIDSVIFTLEFKVHEDSYSLDAIDQVWDYALDLKNFHDQSHDCWIAPVLIPTGAKPRQFSIHPTPHNDKLLHPILCSATQIREVVNQVVAWVDDRPINIERWLEGRYCPTPTIVEAALALYQGHEVAEISRHDAGAKNLHETTDAISEVVRIAKTERRKSICFVTGVPGAGKTLVGLNIATRNLQSSDNTYSVFLSGNGPLVKVLQEALARDRLKRALQSGEIGSRGGKYTKADARSAVKMFIQNVHHYRDEYLQDPTAPADHVALFDEAQRAWDLEQTSKFMKQKKNRPDFHQSEPEFLISCIDRHEDWGVIICLVGGGQEIHTGEAGIAEWIEAIERSFPAWHIHLSDRLSDSEYGAGNILEELSGRSNVTFTPELHLGVSMRSFRAEHVSSLVKQILDIDLSGARRTLSQLSDDYPIVLTRSLQDAKQWVKNQARGSERYGVVASSHAERLKPHAVTVRLKINPIHWFLAGKGDVRSSYYLEDVATEFDIQGLELDWACVVWDGDLRMTDTRWGHFSFRGNRWQRVLKPQRKVYLQNAYRVLLTRARQGMVICVPPGDTGDPTRDPAYYDGTYTYLRSIGIAEI